MNAPALRSGRIALWLLLLACTMSRPAITARASDEQSAPARPVLDALARAWEAEDHGALAARVAPDGVDIAFGRGGRAIITAPARLSTFSRTSSSPPRP